MREGTLSWILARSFSNVDMEYRKGRSMLTFREIEIILETLKKPDTTIEEIANHFNISERTIRYNLDNINVLLRKKRLIPSATTLPVGLDDSVKKDIRNFIETLSLPDLILQPYERYLYIKYTFFLFEKLNLTRISKELQVSRVTIKNDYDQLVEELKKMGLSAELRHKEGFVLIGEEETIRDLQWKTINSISDNRLQYKLLFKPLLSQYMKGIDLDGINRFLSILQEQLNGMFSDDSYQNLQHYLIVTVVRQRNGKAYAHTRVSLPHSDSKEAAVVKAEKRILENQYQIVLTDVEVFQIIKMVLSSRYVKLKDPSQNYWIGIDRLVYKLIRLFSNHYGIDLTKDGELFQSLVNHLKPILFNNGNDLKAKEQISYDVQAEFPEMYEATQQSLQELDLLPWDKESDEEVSLITLHFVAALHRSGLLENAPKNVLLVCSQGIGVSKLLEQQLSREFNVNIIDSIPLHYLDDYSKITHVDVILSTVSPLDLKHDIPVVYLNAILTEDNLQNLEKHGIRKITKKIGLSQLVNAIYPNVEVKNNQELILELKKQFGNLLVDDLSSSNDNEETDKLPLSHVQVIESVSSWEEAIFYAVKPLVDHSYVSEQYAAKVRESFREYGYYMFIEEGVAIPHARSEEDIYKTGFSMVILNEGVAYSTQQTIKVLICFASKDNLEHLDTLVKLVELVKSAEFKAALNTGKNKMQFYELLKGI